MLEGKISALQLALGASSREHFQMDTTRAVEGNLGATRGSLEQGISEVQKAPDTPRNCFEASVVEQSAAPRVTVCHDVVDANAGKVVLEYTRKKNQTHKKLPFLSEHLWTTTYVRLGSTRLFVTRTHCALKR